MAEETTATEAATAMPWTLEFHPVGESGRPQAFKCLNGVKLWASVEDLKIWEHVQALEGRAKAAESELAKATAAAPVAGPSVKRK